MSPTKSRSPETDFARAMAQIMPAQATGIGLAVSGGSDSIALMRLAHGWAQSRNVTLRVASVDHGLRAESAAEAAFVGRNASDLGLDHTTLSWTDWDKRGNLQDAARRARKRLLGDWAQQHGLQAVALGHTRDDQAETVLMRLARGSGVEGLCAMSACDDDGHMIWLRPLLGQTREELRCWLRILPQGWIEDPSNRDPHFDRVKARNALAVLEPLGLGAEKLADTAARLQDARASLDYLARISARDMLHQEYGDYILDATKFDNLPRDTATRILARVLCVVSGATYRPRLKPLRATLQTARSTLHGCMLTRTTTEIRITREYGAVSDLRCAVDQLWDGRWRVIAPDGQAPGADYEIAALGPAGIAQCPDRAGWRLSRRSLLASPAIWRCGCLIAAPLAQKNSAWVLQLQDPACFPANPSVVD